MQRRIVPLAIASLCAMAFTGAHAADADGYPNKTVKIIVGFQAGGPTDVVARLAARALSDALKSPFIVENKPGATSNIASEMVAAAPPDGYTLLLAASPLVMNKYVYPQQKFDPLKSFEPVSKISVAPGVLSVSPKSPAKTYQEFEALAKKKPDGLSYGSTGKGGTQHMAMLRLEELTGMKMVHVPYGGTTGVINDLMSSTIDAAFMTSMGSMPNLVAGKVRPLAVAGPKRLPGLPNVPTFAEVGVPAMKSDSWNALLAPAGTPKAVVDKLAAVLEKAVHTKEFQDALVPQGSMLIGNTPQQFKAELKEEVAFWADQFKKAKIGND